MVDRNKAHKARDILVKDSKYYIVYITFGQDMVPTVGPLVSGVVRCGGIRSPGG